MDKTIEQAVKLFLSDNPMLDQAFAYDVVRFNWDKGTRTLEELVCIEQYAIAYADTN